MKTTGSWRRKRRALLATGFLATLAPLAMAEPIALHPDNPACFLFRGRPTVLVGSGEHYGAVVNLDFDWRKYLDTLAASGLNLTRTFVGSYYEQPGAFGIGKNTLAPAPGRAIVPWARTDTPGASDGGAKVDLERWSPAYFERLRDFVAEAGKREIVVEVVLFSSYYGEGWPHSPMNARNNVNGIGDVPKEKANTLDNGDLLAAQEALVRQVVHELRDADNVYYEIQNEPWADHPVPSGVVHFSILPGDMASPGRFWKNRVDLASASSLAWQARIAEVIADEEETLGVRHLIAQNYANHRYPLRDIDPRISILNFHYAWPDAVALNAAHRRVVGFDETGFANPSGASGAPETDAVYRKQAWEFMLAGGGVFSLLDYSFAVGREDGTLANDAPGGGSPALRRQLRVLKDFLHELDLPRSSALSGLVVSAPGAYASAFGTDDRVGVYLAGDGDTTLALDLGAGRWAGDWLSTLDGAPVAEVGFEHPGGTVELKSPRYDRDVVLRLARGR